MKPLHIVLGVILMAVAMLYAACTDTAPSGPVAGLGSVTVTKYVAVGNSLSAGYQSNGWFASAQIYSFPNLIAGQLKTSGANLGDFQQPLWADPGTPGPDGVHASRYEILSFAGPVIGPNPTEIAGAPSNTALARPYDNLGIPGMIIASFMDTTNLTHNPLVPVVLRSAPLGPFPKSIYQQLVLLQPDFITFWLGNNDVLGFATSGGVSPSSPTDAGIFGALYAQALGALRTARPNAKILVGNIPNVDVIPFFTTLGPRIAASLPPGYYLRYQLHGNTGPAFDSTNLTEANPPLICLTGSPYATLIGRPGGQWYRDHAYPGLPPGIDTTKPFGLHPQNPWPDALVLDAGEQTTSNTATTSFNNAISSVAGTNQAAVVDINGFLNSIKAHGFAYAGQEYSTDYITGGIFSLDGVHPTDRGQGLIANEFIATMNRSFGMSVPYVDIATLPGLPAPITKLAAGGSIPQIPPEAFESLKFLWGAGR